MKPNPTIGKLIYLVLFAIFLIPFVYYISTIANVISLIGLGENVSYVIAFILGITLMSQLPKLIGYLIGIYQIKTHKNPALKKQKPPLKMK